MLLVWSSAHRGPSAARIRRLRALVLILFGAGFAVKILWWVAIAVLILWLIGFVARPKGSSGRWYRW
ncbi:hypothetical protein ABT083_35845 [Streptomyces goshikiensis]